MAVVPSETVTFLFTDIEDSTKLWGHNPEGMARALRRHYSILRDAIERNRGTVFKTVGDAFYAAFTHAPDAVASACEALIGLNQEPWPQDCVINARMALHTGVSEMRDGDYFGPALNRVARILSAGWGGQALLSQATHELIRDHLTNGIGLRDLQEHCLKDLLHPERLYQLVIPGLNNDFPPLSTLTSIPNNLPIQMTAFIGREAEVQEVCNLVLREQVRLVTLHGPGGTGKTRLALQVAAELLNRYSDGVFVVRLEGVPDDGLVPAVIAQVVKVKEAGGVSVAAAVQDYLRDKQMLLVLDNFEQVVEAGSYVAELLGTCAQLEILVTSRISLRVSGEYQYNVPTLATPDPNISLRLTELRRNDSVALFLERAQSVSPNLRLNEENAAAIAEICRRLDGLPLAIELAAARTRLFPPAALLARLDHRLSILTSGARDLPERQQTLRAAIDWSYDLLPPEEKELFSRLAVFAGGFTLEEADAVCSGSDARHIDVVDGVASLLDKSLLREYASRGLEPRFGMLHTVREYALERLGSNGSSEALLRSFATHFRDVVEAAEPGLRSSHPDPWLEQLDDEYDNLRAALDWTRGHDAVLFLCLSARMWRYWFARNRLAEGRRWLEEALGTDADDPLHRAEALRGAGDIAQTQGDYPAGIQYLEGSVALYRTIAERHGLAGALYSLAWIKTDQGDYERAVALHNESLSIYREIDDPWGIAAALDSLAWAAIFHQDRIRSATLHTESLALARKAGDRWTEANSLAGLAWVATLEGRYDEALQLHSQSLTLRQQLGIKLVVAYGLEGIAAIAWIQGQAERASRLWGAAEALREAIGAPLAPFDLSLYQGFRPDESTRDSEAWTDGRSMALDRAIEYAFDENALKPAATAMA